MKICVAGQGAFGQKHLDALKRISGVEVVSLIGGTQDATAEIAKKYGIPHFGGDLSEGIKRADASRRACGARQSWPSRVGVRAPRTAAGCGSRAPCSRG